MGFIIKYYVFKDISFIFSEYIYRKKLFVYVILYILIDVCYAYPLK